MNGRLRLKRFLTHCRVQKQLIQIQLKVISINLKYQKNWNFLAFIEEFHLSVSSRPYCRHCRTHTHQKCKEGCVINGSWRTLQTLLSRWAEISIDVLIGLWSLAQLWATWRLKQPVTDRFFKADGNSGKRRHFSPCRPLQVFADKYGTTGSQWR